MHHLFIFSLLLSSVLSAVFDISQPPPKCITTAPYNVSRVDTQLAVDKAVREGQAWYEYALTWLAENLASLPVSQQQPAVDNFLNVFCTGNKFKGFIGITPVPILITNRTVVGELYRDFFLTAGNDVTFNVKTYNTIITIPPESQTGNRSVHANMTTFLEHLVKYTDQTQNGTEHLSLVLGYYINEWRIDAHGNVCLSRFHDFVRKVFYLDHVKVYSVPWDLRI